MFPWFWIYAPHWPGSGAVTQDIAPASNWFSSTIKPGAGVPEIEQQVFEQASYGKQLGWLMDVMVDALQPQALHSVEARESLIKLKKLHATVQRIKKEHREDRAASAIELLRKIEDDSPEELMRVLSSFEAGRAALQSRRKALPAP